MRIILAGSIGRLPVGGHAWVEMQYLIGLRELGHDVYYLEECGEGSWIYHWEKQQVVNDLDYPADYVRRCLDPIGFEGRWIYRAGEDARGLPVETARKLCASADLFLVRGAPLPLWRDEYLDAGQRVFLDTDPGFTQFKAANGDRLLHETIDRSDVLFTIAQRFDAPDCPVPTLGRTWHKTLSPVALSHWPSMAGDGPEPEAFTCVMQWSSYSDVEYDGVAYGNKNRQWPRFVDLPRRTGQAFRIAMTGRPPAHVDTDDWQLIEGSAASRTPDDYQAFIQQSRAEFSVAKHGYVATQAGWFSDRSVCYLASGRPVLVQDTGLSDWLPVGEGIVTFSDLEQAVEGVNAINRDYQMHCRAARQLAEQYFATERILPAMLTIAHAPSPLAQNASPPG